MANKRANQIAMALVLGAIGGYGVQQYQKRSKEQGVTRENHAAPISIFEKPPHEKEDPSQGALAAIAKAAQHARDEQETKTSATAPISEHAQPPPESESPSLGAFVSMAKLTHDEEFRERALNALNILRHKQEKEQDQEQQATEIKVAETEKESEAEVETDNAEGMRAEPPKEEGEENTVMYGALAKNALFEEDSMTIKRRLL